MKNENKLIQMPGTEDPNWGIKQWGRLNADYVIIKSETYYESPEGNVHEVVIGYNKKAVAKFVTWECINEKNYHWGHYFDNEDDALKDYHERLSNKYKRPF